MLEMLSLLVIPLGLLEPMLENASRSQPIPYFKFEARSAWAERLESGEFTVLRTTVISPHKFLETTGPFGFDFEGSITGNFGNFEGSITGNEPANREQRIGWLNEQAPLGALIPPKVQDELSKQPGTKFDVERIYAETWVKRWSFTTLAADFGGKTTKAWDYTSWDYLEYDELRTNPPKPNSISTLATNDVVPLLPPAPEIQPASYESAGFMGGYDGRFERELRDWMKSIGVREFSWERY